MQQAKEAARVADKEKEQSPSIEDPDPREIDDESLFSAAPSVAGENIRRLAELLADRDDQIKKLVWEMPAGYKHLPAGEKSGEGESGEGESGEEESGEEESDEEESSDDVAFPPSLSAPPPKTARFCCPVRRYRFPICRRRFLLCRQNFLQYGHISLAHGHNFLQYGHISLAHGHSF